MKKNKTISLSLIITMLLLPFVNTIDVSGAPPPSYVGVSEGDVLSWEIDFDGTGIEDMVNDVHTVANELMTFIADDTSTGLEDFIEQFFPNTILDKNLSAGVVEFLIGWI